MAYIYLAIAIVGEVWATAALKATDEFTKPLLSVICLLGYVTSLFFLSLALRSIPVGIAYAIWAGVGTALIAISGYIFYGEALDLEAVMGICLIITGVAFLNVSSATVGH